METPSSISLKAGAPRWALWSVWASVAGVGLSTYMVLDKYRASGRSSCDLSERISCSVINNSAFASLLGIPIAVYGVVWFLVLGFLAHRLHRLHSASSPSSLLTTKPAAVISNVGPTSMSEAAALAAALAGWCLAGTGFVGYLLVAELVLGAICPLCTLVHVLVGFLLHASLRLYARHGLHQPGTPLAATLAALLATTTSRAAVTAAARELRPLLPSLAMLAAMPLVVFLIATSVVLPTFHPSHAALRACVIAQRQQLVLYGSVPLSQGTMMLWRW